MTRFIKMLNLGLAAGVWSCQRTWFKVGREGLSVHPSVSAVVCIASFGEDVKGLNGRLFRKVRPSGPPQHPLGGIPSSL